MKIVERVCLNAYQVNLELLSAVCSIRSVTFDLDEAILIKVRAPSGIYYSIRNNNCSNYNNDVTSPVWEITLDPYEEHRNVISGLTLLQIVQKIQACAYDEFFNDFHSAETDDHFDYHWENGDEDKFRKVPKDWK